MLGHVCQLHYHRGGMVAYHSDDGQLTNIPFSSGPFLKVGQAVSFSIVDHAAVNIVTAARGARVELTGCATSHDAVQRGTSVVLSTSWGSQQSKRLQREVGRFHNATVQEQLDWVRQAEAELGRLLED